MAKAIDSLSVVVSANTGPLAKDLRQAGRELEQFGKSADRAAMKAMKAGATGAPRMPAGPPRARPTDGLFADYAAAKKRAAGAAAVDKVRDDALASARRKRLEKSIDAFPRVRDEFNARHAGLSARLGSYGQPGAMSRTFGWAAGATKNVAGGAGSLLSTGFEKTRTAASAAGGSMAQFARDAASVASGVVVAEAGLSSFSAAFAHLKDSVFKAADFEMQRVGFEVLLKSATDADSMLADIRKFAASTPFRNDELADSARMLLAYGLAAEKVMPAIKMLGDVSAATGGRLQIRDASYLYGTLRSQGRAYARDILQFSNAGVSINEELAAVLGKQPHEIAPLVEEGRIDFRDVEKAFQRMTSVGGRFYQMTERQGQTARASFEQLADSIDTLKIAFGQVLIEELDLRGASRDIGAFAARVRDAAGEARPFVRQLGEMGRGAVNVGAELAQAAVGVASITFDSVGTAFPKLREVRGELAKLIEDAKSFRVDERQMVRVGFALGGALVESTADATRMVGLYGTGMTSLFETIVRSARQASTYMETAAKWVSKINDAMPPGSRFLVQPLALTIREGIDAVAARNADAMRNRRPGDPVNASTMEPPGPGISADRVREEWPAFGAARERLTAEIEREQREVDAGRLRPVWVERTRERLADVQRREGAYLGGFDMDLNVARAALNRGDVPAIRPASPPAPPDLLSELERDIARLRQNFFEPMSKLDVAKFRQDWTARLDARLGEIDRREAAAAIEGDRRLALVGAVGPAAMFPPGATSSPSFATTQNRAAAWGAAVGPIAAAGRVPDPLEPARPEQMTLGVDLRRQHDPRIELEQYRKDLDAVRLHRLAGPDTNAIVDRAWMEKLRDVGQRFGVGRTVELPSTVEAGSADDARLINTWRSQQAAQTPEAMLLQQILQTAQQHLQLDAGRPGAPQPQQSSWFIW